MTPLFHPASRDDKLQVLVLTLDRVFDVAFEDRDEVNVTRFSIAFDGREVRDLTLLGHVEVAHLTRVKVLLADRDSWPSLLAVRDLVSGHTHWNMVADFTAELLVLFSLPLIYGVAAAISYGNSRNAWLLFAAFVAYGALSMLIHERRQAALQHTARERLNR